jgi:mannose-1-phosphate guanylyltransferase/mannose-6-phosphate isomerase
MVLCGWFRVKSIHVNPGAPLSLQSHHQRADHWIVVLGTAPLTVGEEERLVTENQSVYGRALPPTG